MTAALKGNSDGSGAIQTGGVDAIQISSAQVVTIPQSLTVTGTLTASGGVFSTGSVLQVVQASTTTSTATTVITTAGVTTTLTGTITPKSATSKILVQVNVGWVFSNQASAAGYATFSLYRGASQIVTTWFRGPHLPGVNTSTYAPASGSYLDSPATTAATTYTLYFNTTAASVPQTVQASSTPSYITLTEIAG